MHDVIEKGLEEYLGGSVNREMETHLAQCERCRSEVEEIRQLSSLLGTYLAEAPMEPALGFSQRVMRRVAEDKGRSLWSVLSVDPGFARKLVLASLLSLAALGGYLATQPLEGENHTPESVLASHDVYSTDQQQHLDGMLVTLATYHQ